MQAESEAKMKFKNFKKTKTYKESEVYSTVINYIFLLSGFSIIIGAIYGIVHNGIYYFENGHEVLNLNGIVTVVFVTAVGTVLILFSRVNIKIHL